MCNCKNRITSKLYCNYKFSIFIVITEFSISWNSAWNKINSFTSYFNDMSNTILWGNTFVWVIRSFAWNIESWWYLWLFVIYPFILHHFISFLVKRNKWGHGHETRTTNHNCWLSSTRSHHQFLAPRLGLLYEGWLGP